jgi:hypothetical protein
LKAHRVANLRHVSDGGESSRMSSPLTSLSDLEDMDQRLPPSPSSSKERNDPDELRVARVCPPQRHDTWGRADGCLVDKLLCRLRLAEQEDAPRKSSKTVVQSTSQGALSAPPPALVIPAPRPRVGNFSLYETLSQETFRVALQSEDTGSRAPRMLLLSGMGLPLLVRPQRRGSVT